MRRSKLALILMVFVALVTLPLALPSGVASAIGPCDLSADLAPEMAGGGVDGLVRPPADSASAAPPSPSTNYDRYGMAGQFWHTYDLGCSDVAAVLGNAWANTVFSWAKAIDRLTISTYQAAATEGPLQPIKEMADQVVTSLANAMYWPYLRPIVILGAIWLAWYGLIRRRATMTTEGVIWMVLAVTVAIWFFSRPGDFTSLGKTVADQTGQVVNSALSGLPGAGGASCLPAKGDTAAGEVTGGYGRPGTSGVAQNADALWSTLVCKPWLMGEFGTADANAPVVRTYGAKLLDIQAIDADEQAAKQMPGSDSHQKRFEQDIVAPLENTPVFFLIQGKDWTSRLGIAIGAFIAALVAGLLIFLVAVSLLVLKVGFLLLLMLGPVFLLIGVHPGSGRIIAMRWLEMLVGTLLRQAVLAVVLGLLVYGYALIIATSLPWGMQILFMALLTIAVFFYRRPFQHLFASMDGHTITTRMLGEAATAPTLSRAANALPPVAAARMGRWGLRRAEPLLGATAMAAGAGTAAAVAGAVAQGRSRAEEAASATGQAATGVARGAAAVGSAGTAGTTSGGQVAAGGAAVRAGAQPAPLDTDQQASARRRAGVAPRVGSAPPLNLSGSRPGGSVRPEPRDGQRSGSTARAAGGWFSGGSGGWASRPSSGSRPGERSSWRGLLDGGGSAGGPRGGARGGTSGRGLFGGGRESGTSPRTVPFRDRTGSRDHDASASRSRTEPPPLWLPRRDGSADSSAPFWAQPVDRDSGD